MGRKPMDVRNVGRSVSKLAWTVGEILLMIFTAGLAWPFIWMRHRSKTRIIRHG